MKNIKVLHISETFAAGVYTYLKELCSHCEDDDNIESYIIYSGNRIDTNKDKFKCDFSNKTKLIEVSMEREISPIKDIVAVVYLIKQINKIKPDIIHLHSSKAGVLGRLASVFFPKVKVYYTPHGYAFTREDISKFKKKLYWNIEKYMINIFGGTTIACGDTEYEYALNMGPAILIRNGVKPIAIINGNKDELKEDEVSIGTIGRISAQKNPKLFNEIARCFPDIKFIWIGDGELRNSLTSKNITVTGWLDRQEVLEMTNSFTIYLQTSLWEGLPFTILEAMSLGKPIVATNVIGNKDAVSNGDNGYLCEDITQFRKAITKIIENKDLQNKLSDNSLVRINKDFHLESNFKMLLETYFRNTR